MGHAGCGGVAAHARGQESGGPRPLSPGDFTGKWISLLDPAAARIERAGLTFQDYVERLALASIVQALANLRTFPWIAAREQQKTLCLHGAYFGIAAGTLLAFDEAGGGFLPVTAAPATGASDPAKGPSCSAQQ
jgi:carbonic anhydrase